jgi:hypothetical protein
MPSLLSRRAALSVPALVVLAFGFVWTMAACLNVGGTGAVADGGHTKDGTIASDGGVVDEGGHPRDARVDRHVGACGCTGGLVCGIDGGCQACATNAECDALDAGTPTCQLGNADASTYARCVACTASTPCPKGEVCDLAGVDDPTGLGGPRTPNLCYPDCRTTPGTCTPGASFCVPDSGLCGFGCLTTENACAPVGQVCNTDAGVCVACLSSSDCPINLPGCLSSHCGDCASASDCPGGQSCDAIRGLCHCSSSAQCGALAPTCDVTLFKGTDGGVELGCGCVVDAGACPTGTKCNVGIGPKLGGECLPLCDHDGGPNCESLGLVCISTTGLCAACTTSTECAGNPHGLVCALDGGASGSCVCTIGAAATCPAGTVCNPPMGCTSSCTSDGGACSVGVCDRTTGACRGCVKTSDCSKSAAGTVCDNGDGGTFECICHSPADCLDPKAGCSASLQRCGVCDSPQDCPTSNPGCNSQSASCGSCALSTDCPAAVPSCSDAGLCH